MVVTATLLLAGLILLPNKGEFALYVVGAFVFAMGSLLAILFLVWVSSKPFLNRIPLLVSAAGILSRIPLLASAAGFLVELSKAKGVLVASVLLTLGHWLLLGLCAWVLAHGMGLGITPFVATLAILGTLYFATAMPALPAAVGTFEFAIVYVLKFFDVPQSLAFSYGVVIHAVIFLPPIIVAIVVFTAIGFRSVKQGDSNMPRHEGKAMSFNGQERRSG